MIKKTKTINAFTDAFIERKLDPVKDFNEVYGGTSKKFSGLIGHSLVNTIKDKKSNQKIVLLRMLIEPAGVEQPYMLAVNHYNRLVVIDLVSYQASIKEVVDKHEEKIIKKPFAYKIGKLIVNSEKMINFSESNDINSLAAYVISACGFVSNGDSSKGEDFILTMM